MEKKNIANILAICLVRRNGELMIQGQFAEECMIANNIFQDVVFEISIFQCLDGHTA